MKNNKMFKTYVAEIAFFKLWTCCCVSLASLMVATAWHTMLVMPAHAQSSAEDAKTTASAVKETHMTASTVLLLPPKLPAGASGEACSEAELACDRLSQEITAAGLAHVVDRTQLDRVLKEHQLTSGPSGPMLSYDAMIRLEADTARLAPETILSVIDLSTGNTIAKQSFSWPPKEDAMKQMLDFCREALRDAAKSTVGKLRVRTIWSSDAIPNERMRPLGRRLIEVFDEALKRSDRVVLVRHLEAATAKEESLLLLMGMSRLPAGRQFTPQADATIELRLVEGDGQGKTFPETPIEIGARLRNGTDYQGDWAVTTGLVQDFDAMIPQAWQKLSQLLGEIRPETASVLLNEMALRHKQAEAELRIIKDLEKGLLLLDVRLSQLEHAQAALKLDPTNVEAVRAYVLALSFVCLNQAISQGPPKVPDASHRTIIEAVRYLERFRKDGETCSCLCECGNQGLRFSQLYRIYGYRVNEEPLQPIAKNAIAFTPELRQELDAVKQLLERGLDHDVKLGYDSMESMTVVIYHGMRLFANTRLDERLKWLDTVHRRCADKIITAEKDPNVFSRHDWLQYFRLQCRMAELLLEDGQLDRAKQIIIQAQAEFPKKYQYPTPFLMRAVIGKTGDAQLLADYERWLVGEKAVEAKEIVPPTIEWPALDIFAGQKTPAPFNRFDGSGPHLPLVEIRGKRPPDFPNYPRHRPLAEGDGRLYFLTSSPQYRIAYVPLDQQGRPIGKASPNQYGTLIWDNIKNIPQPDLGKPRAITSAKYFHGKLLVGTAGSGLHIFDPKTEVWKQYGPAQGLPTSSIEEFFPIDDHVLYCRSGNCHCTLNTANGAITLVGRSKPMSEEEYYGWPLRHVWRNGEVVMALCQHNIWKDLFGKERKNERFAAVSCHGWAKIVPTHRGVLSAAEVGGRRFYLCHEGLHEFDATGSVIRSWWLPQTIESVGNLGNIKIPSDSPIANSFDFLYAAGTRLVLASHDEIAIYNVKTDMWYGPFQGAEWIFATPSGGLWGKTTMSDGLIYFSLCDLESYAKTVGRAMTSVEYSRRKQRLVDTAKPLDRAKLAIVMRQNDQAKSALKQVLAETPGQPEALFLMNYLQSQSSLNPSDREIKR